MADKTICTPMKQEYFAKLKSPIAVTRMLNHEKKKSAHHLSLTKQFAIGFLRISTQLKFQLPPARTFCHKIKQQRIPCVPNPPCMPTKTICNPIGQEYLEKLKIATASSKIFLNKIKQTEQTMCV